LRIQSGQLIPLGHGRFVRSDDVVAIEPIHEGRGPGRRALVWVRGVPEPLVASRTAEWIAGAMVSPAESAAAARELALALEEMAHAVEVMPPVLQRVVQQETGEDLLALANRARKALSS
jgi:hypothetical protein